MIENFAGADLGSGAVRRPYEKPILHNLDLSETESKSHVSQFEHLSSQGFSYATNPS